jgi:hypothetical protein
VVDRSEHEEGNNGSSAGHAPNPLPRPEAGIDGSMGRPDALRSTRRTAVGDRPRRFVVPLLFVVIGAVAAGSLLLRRSDTGNAALSFRPACVPSATVRCLQQIDRSEDALVATFVGDPNPLTIALPDSNDVVVAGNWFCGPTESLAIYRPSDGTVRYYRGWPVSGAAALTVAAVGDRTGIVNATSVIVGDRNGDECSDLALDGTDGTRTWFEPVRQPRRLEPIQTSG